MLDKFSITMMSGPRDGEIMVFPVQDVSDDDPLILTVGRRDGSDIRLNYDSQVSRLHAHVGYDGNIFWIEDMGSRNGTFIEDDALPSGEKRSIVAGTLFRVGRTWLRLDPLPNDITAAAEPFPVVEDDDETTDNEDD